MTLKCTNMLQKLALVKLLESLQRISYANLEETL